MRLAFALAATSVLGCSFPTNGAAESDSVDGGVDTSLEDSTLAETITPDTFVDVVADSFDGTTDDADANEVLDVGAEDGADATDAFGPPLVTATCTGLATGSVVSLTTAGKLGWAHFGMVDATTFTHKQTSSSIVTPSSAPGAPLRYDGYGVQFSWTDGDPFVSGTTKAGIFQYQAGYSMGFTAAGDPTAERTLNVYVDCSNCVAQLVAKLDDGSAMSTTPLTTPSFSATLAICAVTYRTAAPGVSLVVTLTHQAAAGSGSTSTSLLAATLN